MIMLTGTMNAKDFRKVYKSDRDRIYRYLYHREAELRRQMKKGFSKKCAKCYDYHTPSADYKLSMCVYSRRCIIDVYMYIKETNEYVVVTAKDALADDTCLVVFTPHYIRRMGERIHGDRNMDVNKILTYFILHSNTAINIYHKGNDYVFAIHGGISLARYDSKRELMVLKTFVSKEMLKNTQKVAFGRVASLVDKFDKFTEDESERNGNTSRTILSQMGKELDEIDLEEINDIYGQYFKND